jgi:hypothetical protein
MSQVIECLPSKHKGLSSNPSTTKKWKEIHGKWPSWLLCRTPIKQSGAHLKVCVTNNRCWWGCGEKGTLIHCWWECKLVQPLWKKIWRLLKNLNIDLPYDPAIPLVGIHPKECSTGYSRGTCTPMFIAALFTIAKLWKQPRCPTTDEWIKKNVVYLVLII